MVAITFHELTAAVGGSVVVDDVSLAVADGEFIGVIGRSGSGKTSLLRTVAGFTDIVRGRLLFDGVDVTAVKTADRDVGMVGQEPVLFPSRTVQRNVSFPLELRGQELDEIRRRVGAEVRAMHLDHLLSRHPRSLSRGEAQLVQIARSLVRTPRVLLLDEPLASLDVTRRRQMRAELAMLQEGYQVTTMMATNDAEDALSMPHRLVVMDGGRIVQVDRPEAVRRSPATVDAAVATGDCRFVHARVRADTEGFWLTMSSRAAVPTAAVEFRHRVWHSDFADHVGTDVVLGIRPTDVAVAPVDDAAGHVGDRLRGTIERVVPGASGGLECDAGGWRLGARAHAGAVAGDVVSLRIEHLVAFDAEHGRRIG